MDFNYTSGDDDDIPINIVDDIGDDNMGDDGSDSDNDDDIRPDWIQVVRDSLAEVIQALPHVAQQLQERPRRRLDRTITEQLDLIHQRLGRIEYQIQGMPLRMANAGSSHSYHLVLMLPNDQGVFPIVGQDGITVIPETRDELDELLAPPMNALINFYGLAVPPRSTQAERKRILKEHLGFF